MDDDTIREIEKWLENFTCERKITSQKSYQHMSMETSQELFVEIPRGEVRPSQSAFVIKGREKELSSEIMDWGFPKYKGKGLIINARAESAKEKTIFRDSILHRRCVIPAKCYFEWDAAKEKVTFSRKQGEVLYMAGFYQKYGNQDCFVILTTNANGSVRPVHDRMPLILDEDEVEKWIFEDQLLDYFLQKTPVSLNRRQEYEQVRLPFL